MRTVSDESPGDPAKQTRKNARVAVDAFVKVIGTDGEFVFRTRDLSEGGLFLYTKVAHTYPFRVGSTLTLELYDYDEYVSCEVLVVRVVQPSSAEAGQLSPGFGVRIAKITEFDRAKLRAMIGRVGEGGELT